MKKLFRVNSSNVTFDRSIFLYLLVETEIGSNIWNRLTYDKRNKYLVQKNLLQVM